MKADLFQFRGHCWVFHICWHMEWNTFIASSFRIWNSSAGIPSPPLALFLVMLSKAHLTSHSRMSGSRWVITPSCAGSQREELRPWQRSQGRRLSIRKGVIKPQETPCSRASTPKPESTYFTVSCFRLHLWLYGGLFPTGSLGEGVTLQLQVNENSWAWQECFNLQTPLKVI